MFHKLSQRTVIRICSFVGAALIVLLGGLLRMQSKAAAYERAIATDYLRAFSQVVTSVDRIDSAMQKELYVTSPAMIAQFSAEIQAEAATAQQAMAALPYANIELEQTASFLSKVGDYASALSRAAAANGALSEEEMDNLYSFSQVSTQLSQRLEELETQLNDGSMSLHRVDEVKQRMSELTEGDTQIAGSDFDLVENHFPEVPTMTYDGPFSDHLSSSQPKVLESLPEVTEQQAITSAAACLELPESVFTVEAPIDGEIPAYALSAAVDGGELNCIVTKAGGMVMGVTNSRAIGAPTISEEEAISIAGTFLTRNSYETMEPTYYYNHSGRLTINFAHRQGDVLCYPDLCSITVAMDNGGIVSFESTSYLSNHHQRTDSTPVISSEEAKTKVSPRLTILKEQLAWIPTDGEYEVLCWEYICEAENGQHYVVCINSETGAEQKILILLEDENGTLAL